MDWLAGIAAPFGSNEEFRRSLSPHGVGINFALNLMLLILLCCCGPICGSLAIGRRFGSMEASFSQASGTAGTAESTTAVALPPAPSCPPPIPSPPSQLVKAKADELEAMSEARGQNFGLSSAYDSVFRAPEGDDEEALERKRRMKVSPTPSPISSQLARETEFESLP